MGQSHQGRRREGGVRQAVIEFEITVTPWPLQLTHATFCRVGIERRTEAARMLTLMLNAIARNSLR